MRRQSISKLTMASKLATGDPVHGSTPYHQVAAGRGPYDPLVGSIMTSCMRPFPAHFREAATTP